jgi:signal peptidase II
MAEPGDAPRRRPRRLEVWLPILIVVFDQSTKLIVRRGLPLHDSVTVIPGLLDFTHVRNTGAAFGMLNAVDFPFKTALLALISTGALVGVAIYSLGLARQQILARLGLSLIIGGAGGNLIDRLIDGSVVDFVDAYWRTYHFWAFNVADSAISVGVTLMLIDMLWAGNHASKTV